MKNVLITGGSRGIGKACVQLFSQNGWNVFFTYVANDKAAQDTAKICGAVAVKADVSKSEDLEKIKQLCSNFDCIVNNAGIAEQKLFTDITEEDWNRMFDVNVKGVYLTTRCFLPGMISRHKGSIINVSSVWGVDGASCEVHYSASKAAVIGFTKALAKEVGPSGIRVNCVAPGVIDTDMNSHLSEEDISALTDETPLCSVGSAEQVAKTILFLADSESFITGETIKISGGF